MSEPHQKESEKAEVDHVHKTTTADGGDTEAANARGVQADDIPAGYWWSPRFLGSAASVGLLACSLFINFNLPASAITVINKDLGYAPSYIWISDASTVVACVGLLIVGRLSDILGRRPFLLAGQVFGVVGAAVCAKASSQPMLIAGATLYGVATTTQLTFPVIVQEIVPNKHRGVAQALVTLAVLPFAGFGSIVARQLIAHAALGWRWVYLLNVVFNAATLVLLALCYFPPALRDLHTGWTWRTELAKMDYGGIVLFAGLSVLLLLGLNWGGSTYAWTDAHVLAPLVLGCALIPVFALYETYMPLEQPILPTRLFRNRPYVALVVLAGVGQMTFFSLAILWPEQIESLYTTDNIQIGWMAVTSNLALIVGEVVFGLLLRVLGHTRLQLIVSSALVFAFLAALGGTTHKGQAYPLAFTTLVGLLSGWLDVVVLVANGLVNAPGDLGLANGFLGSIKQLVGTISVSIYVAILSNRYAANLPKDVSDAAVAAGLDPAAVPAAVAAAANGTAAALAAVPGMTAAIETAIAGGVRRAWADTFSVVYYASLSFAGLALAAAFFTSDIDEHMNAYVNRRIAGTPAMAIPAERTIKNAHLTDEDE